MALIGKALANQIPESTTGKQAAAVCRGMLAALGRAYGVVDAYDPSGLAQASGLDAGSVEAAKMYLDGQREYVDRVLSDCPTSDNPIASTLLARVRAAASGSSTACKYVDDNFQTSFAAELSAEVVAVTGTIVGKIGDAVSTVAGSFIGSTWWVWILVGLALLGWRKLQKGGAQ